MEYEPHQAVSKPIINNGYRYQFEFNGLPFRVGVLSNPAQPLSSCRY